ncbi:formin-like protein 5 [Syzygium oleosum]|uniref:formin-like protein 5 n=1 Tax=Syzygium oleosum TaxID=219896 RepID=UPI0011D1E645|nr:formin-like protein 5 [Syzygium oleosum]
MGVKMHEALQPPPAGPGPGAGPGDDRLRHKPGGRKPLQPRNSSPAALPSGDQPKPKPERIGISPVLLESDKENRPYPPPPPPSPPSSRRAAAAPPPPPPALVVEEQEQQQQLDASLAEELVAVRKKLERLRADGERTEAMLKERDGFLATKAREVEERGEVQKLLEIEVDRLYRLKQLKLSLARVSPIRSLRERSHINQESRSENREESVGECEAPSPSSVSSKLSADED